MSLKNIDSLKSILSRTIQTFIRDKTNPKDVHEQFLTMDYNSYNSYSVKRFLDSNDISDLELKKIASKFISEEYFKTINSLETFAIFCYDILSYSLTDYSVKANELYTDLEPDELKNKIKVFLKGGNVLNAVFFKNVRHLPVYLRNKIIDEYSKYFNPSDFDFEIIVSHKLSKKEEFNNDLYDKVYSDLCHLSYFILNDIREYFIRHELDIFDYPKYNESLKKNLLNKLKDTINQSDYCKDKKLYLCKLVHDNLYIEEPCINDVRFDYENQYDHVVQSSINVDGSKGNKVSAPRKFNRIYTDKINNYYISMNNSLDFIHGSKRAKFFLARLKSLFNFYFMENLEWQRKYRCCNFKKIGGELIDIVINHKDSTDIHRVEDLQELKIKDKTFLTMNEKMLIDELHDILFINFTLPWNQSKSDKRLKRYFGFMIIFFINKYSSNEDILDYVRNNINNILITFDKILISESPYDFTDYNIEELGRLSDLGIPNSDLAIIFDTYRNLPELFRKISEELGKIADKDLFTKKRTKDFISINLKEFIESWKQNYIFVLKIIESVKLGPDPIRDTAVKFKRNKYLINYKSEVLNYSQSGGFNSCNANNKNYVLPTILKYFNKFTNTKITDSSTDLFKSLCQEIFQRIKDPGTYQSMVKYGDDPVPVVFEINYTVSITFFVFLSFIVEYFLFIIVYQKINIINPNTITFNYNTLNEKRNNYNNIWKNSTIATNPLNNQNLTEKMYRKNLEDMSINQLLSEFCLDLDRLFYRFMVTIIFNLKIKTSKKIKELKKYIFPDNLKRKNETTESKYENIYPDWKDKIKAFTGISDLELNNIIKKSLEHIADHTSKIDNEYTPDATGFFSWMYLLPEKRRRERNDQNTALKFGSCITNTYLEIYLLIRINEDPSNVGVGLESQNNTRHNYWINTQNELQSQSPGFNNHISHWFTIWKDSPANITLFREAPGFQVHHLSKNAVTDTFLTTLNIKNKNQKKMIQSLILPIFDSYSEYCRQNPTLNNKLIVINDLVSDFIKELNIAYP